MKTVRTLDQAKRDLQVIQDYVKLIEEYQPKNFVQQVVHTYILNGSIVKTAFLLNNQGYTVEQRAIKPNDVSAIIRSTPAKDDFLHKKIKSLYLKKIRSARKMYSGY